MKYNKISASILGSKKLLYDLKICESMGIDCLHIDWFANKSIDNKLQQILDYSSIPLDFHIIGFEEKIIQDLISYKPRYCSFQYHEKEIKNIVSSIALLQNKNIQCGICLCIGDDIQILEKNLFDYVMVMNTVPGVSGQPIDIEKSLKYVKKIRKLHPDLPIHIDGGVDNKTKQKYKDLNVRIFVCGSYLFKSESLYKNIFRLKDREFILRKTVKEYIKKGNNFKISKNATVEEIINKIDYHKAGFAMITHKEKLHGIVTDGDIRRLVLNRNRNLININPITCTPDETLLQMYSKVSATEKHVQFIPIVDQENKLLGFIDLNNVNGEINEF